MISGEAGAFREVLAQQAVGVLVAARTRSARTYGGPRRRPIAPRMAYALVSGVRLGQENSAVNRRLSICGFLAQLVLEGTSGVPCLSWAVEPRPTPR